MILFKIFLSNYYDFVKQKTEQKNNKKKQQKIVI